MKKLKNYLYKTKKDLSEANKWYSVDGFVRDELGYPFERHIYTT